MPAAAARRLRAAPPLVQNLPVWPAAETPARPRRGGAWPGSAGPGKAGAWLGSAGQCKYWLGMARLGRPGQARFGMARRGWVGLGRAWRGLAGAVWHGPVGSG